MSININLVIPTENRFSAPNWSQQVFSSLKMQGTRGFWRLIRCLSIGLIFAQICSSSIAVQFDEEQDSDKEHTESLQSEVILPLDAATTHGIKTAPVGKRLLTESITAFARVSYNANAIARVGSSIEGRVIELRAGLGDAVTTHDELLVLDSLQLADAQGDLLQKRSIVASAKTQVDIAQIVFKRSEALVQKNGTSIAEYQRAAGDLHKAQNELRSAETAVVAAERKLRLLGFTDESLKSLGSNTTSAISRFSVRSPIAGRIIEHNVGLGEVIEAGREDLVVITDTSRIWILADVPDYRLREVKSGDMVQVHVPAASALPFNGYVSSIAPATNPALRTGEVRIEVTNKDGILKAGMFAQCEIALSQNIEEKLAVPEQAVVKLGSITAVFVGVEYEPDSFERRKIKIGKPVGGWVPILSGLQEGEEVVTTGTFLLKAELGRANVKE